MAQDDVLNWLAEQRRKNPRYYSITEIYDGLRGAGCAVSFSSAWYSVLQLWRQGYLESVWQERLSTNKRVFRLKEDHL